MRMLGSSYNRLLFFFYVFYINKNVKSILKEGRLMVDVDFLQYGIKIFVITSFKDTCYIEILPSIQKSERGKFLLLLKIQ